MKKITLYIFGILFFIQTAGFSAAAFSDVPATHKYSQDIQYLEDKGIVHDGLFKPSESITRAVFAKWLLENSGFKIEGYQPKTKGSFVDIKVKENSDAPYIYKLVDLGVLNFSETEPNYFKPKNLITKKEALSWIFEVEGINVPKIFNEVDFQATDVKIGSTIAPLIHRAIGLNFLKPGKIHAYAKLTRGEAAHFLKVAKSAVPTLTVTIVPSVDSDIIDNKKFQIMASVWNKVFQTYLRREGVNKEALIYGSIEGMVKELGDKHSDFERPGQNALIESLSGEIEGIGAVIQSVDDEVVVVAPIAGSPAEKAGLRASDIITLVDGVDIKGMKLTDVVARIKGKKGTQVKITVRRGGTVLAFDITRDVVKIISASMKRTDDNIAKITLSNFGENTIQEFQPILDDISKNAPKGIIIDMRNNPGGFLNTAVELGGSFIKSGDRVARVKYPDHEDNHDSSGNAALAKYKIMVLVNKGSASASEILAGSLQEYGIAKVIGEKTYGKGTVQELSDFSDGSTLKLTVAEWLTPNGKSIEGVGITPDIEVTATDDDQKTGRDPQMDRALVELRK